MTLTLPSSDGRVSVEPSPAEVPLQIVAAVVALGLWGLLILSIFGIVYAIALGAFFFVAHLTLIAHIRGNGIRLGPDQFPELHQSVVRLSYRIGLPRVPEAYLMQADGALNAFATRFLSTDLVVLFSDLLDACGEGERGAAARDMIVGHELGHVKRGHLRWHWFLMPVFLVPFLGTALSRAREYTCDRYGRALAGDAAGALLGLSILAAGGKRGPLVNHLALVRQRASLNTGFMTLAEWLATHPPLAKRLAEVDPVLAAEPYDVTVGRLRALGILGTICLPFLLGGVAAALLIPRFASEAEAEFRRLEAEAAAAQSGADGAPASAAINEATVREDFAALSAFLQDELKAGRGLPANADDLYQRWQQVRRGEGPIDPFDGERYGYVRAGAIYFLWSAGPDNVTETGDDLTFDSRTNLVGTGPARDR